MTGMRGTLGVSVYTFCIFDSEFGRGKIGRLGLGDVGCFGCGAEGFWRIGIGHNSEISESCRLISGMRSAGTGLKEAERICYDGRT